MATPRLGIFWLVGEEIVSFSTPLDRAEHAGGFANYRHGHVDLRRFVCRSRPRLRGVEYEFAPRGRVTYDVADDAFNLLVPTAFLNDRDITSRLVEGFSLPPAQVRVIADAHYDPRGGTDTCSTDRAWNKGRYAGARPACRWGPQISGFPFAAGCRRATWPTRALPAGGEGSLRGWGGLTIQDASRRTTASRVWKSTGLVRCVSKPASRLCRRSSSVPSPVRAIPLTDRISLI